MNLHTKDHKNCPCWGTGLAPALLCKYCNGRLMDTLSGDILICNTCNRDNRKERINA